MVVQHPLSKAILSQDRFETLEVRKDDDTFVIINRWLSDEPARAKVIILNPNEALALVRFLSQHLS